jgi:glycosyltransferase involved in cell wall biosynthesis
MKFLLGRRDAFEIKYSSTFVDGVPTMTSISIAMGTFNGARFLSDQLNSLAGQTLLPVELQIGDDGSTDETVQIITEFARTAPFAVTLLRNGSNLGYGENFLQTARRCRGEWVAFCDQDDIWLPNKLQCISDTIQHSPNDLQLVVHAATITNAANDTIGRLDTPENGLYNRLSMPPEWVCQGFRQVFRRSLLDRFATENRTMPWHIHPDAHDTWTCLYAGIAGDIIVISDLLVQYRRHETNTTVAVGVDRQSSINRIFATFSDNADHYCQIANVYRDIAHYLRARAGTSPIASSDALLGEAEIAVAAYGQQLDSRAQVYRGQTLTGRFRAFRSLFDAGSYRTDHRWSFGPKAAIKDFLGMLKPRLRSSDKRPSLPNQ